MASQPMKLDHNTGNKLPLGDDAGDEIIAKGKTDNGYMTEDFVEVSQLTASDTEAYDLYGTSVAITPDGLVAMVGASKEDTVASDAGKIYTYKRDSIDEPWVEVSQLTANDAGDGDFFGRSVTITPDGLVAMVGADIEDIAAAYAGKVYTYKRDSIDELWVEVSQLTASDAETGDFFGVSVTMTSDGLVSMVGAYAEDTAASIAGKVYTYKRDSIDEPWTEVHQLTSSDAEAYDYFGMSVSISGDGLVAIVGAAEEDTAAAYAGKVYTYKRDSIDEPWIEVSQLTASNAEAIDRFGTSIAMAPDGLVAIIGTWGPNKVYIYERATIDDAWTEVSIIHESYNLGNAVAIASDAKVILIGAIDHNNEAGTVYEYKRTIGHNRYR